MPQTIEPLNRRTIPTTAITAAMIHKTVPDILASFRFTRVTARWRGEVQTRSPTSNGSYGHCTPNRPT